MKQKMIKSLLVLLVAIGLAACSSTEENPDSIAQPIETEQGTGEISSADTNEQDLEQLFGDVLAIDGMNITIGAVQVMVFNESGTHQVSPGSVENEPQEPQKTIIRLTEQTVIRENTVVGGQIVETRSVALGELPLQAFVMADGVWQGDEFIATNLTIINSSPMTFD